MLQLLSFLKVMLTCIIFTLPSVTLVTWFYETGLLFTYPWSMGMLSVMLISINVLIVAAMVDEANSDKTEDKK